MGKESKFVIILFATSFVLASCRPEGSNVSRIDIQNVDNTPMPQKSLPSYKVTSSPTTPTVDNSSLSEGLVTPQTVETPFSITGVIESLWEEEIGIEAENETHEYPNFPEGLGEPFVEKINELRNAGYNISVTETDEANKYLLKLSTENDDTVETHALGEIRYSKILDNVTDEEIVGQKLNIVTDKDEPLAYSPEDIVIRDGNIIIIDSLGGFVAKGEELLVFDGKWTSSIKFLKAGYGYNSKYYPTDDYLRSVTEANKNERLGVYGFQGVLVDRRHIGFYDKEGYLHIYEIAYSNLKPLGLCTLNNSRDIRSCKNALDADVENILERWEFMHTEYNTLLIEVYYSSDFSEEDMLFHENLFKAINENGEFPSATDGKVIAKVIKES